MNWKKVLLFGVVILAAVVAYVWFFIINKDHDNIDKIKAKYTVETNGLVGEFETQYDTAWKKYNEQVMDIKGTVSAVLPNDSISSVVFKVSENYEIYCEVYPRHNEAAKALKPNDVITIHGQFLGAEKPDADFDLIGLLRLKKCSIKK